MFQTLHEISKNLIFVFVWKYVWKYVNINVSDIIKKKCWHLKIMRKWVDINKNVHWEIIIGCADGKHIIFLIRTWTFKLRVPLLLYLLLFPKGTQNIFLQVAVLIEIFCKILFFLFLLKLWNIPHFQKSTKNVTDTTQI